MAAELVGKRWKAEQEAAAETKHAKAVAAKEPGGDEYYGDAVSVAEGVVLYVAICVSAFLYFLTSIAGPDHFNPYKAQGDPRLAVLIVFFAAGMFAIGALKLTPWRSLKMLFETGRTEKGSEFEKRFTAAVAKESYSAFAIGIVMFLFFGIVFTIFNAVGAVAKHLLTNEICGGAVFLLGLVLGAAIVIKLWKYIDAAMGSFYLESQKFSLGLRMFYTLLFIAVITIPFTFSIFTGSTLLWVNQLFFLSIFIGAVATALDLPLVLGIERGLLWALGGTVASAMIYLPALLVWMNKVALPPEIGGVYGAVFLASMIASFLLGFLRSGKGREDNATAIIALLASLAYVSEPVIQNAIIVATLLGMAALIYFRAKRKKPVSA